MELLHATARTLIEWMFYCLVEGVGLAVFVWLLLRLLPRQNAGTRFALWFSVLLATVVLPLLGGPGRMMIANSHNGTTARSLIMLSDSWAMISFIFWALFAAVALARVAAGLCQVNRLRRNSEPVDPRLFAVEIQSVIGGCSRQVTLRCSDAVHVPAAIGFFRPAIVVPRWFLEEVSPAELKQVLLHELTHLNRLDDWTNLAQKIVKALLFFHPSVWWVEQRLSLEREMACDDAVLAQAASPQDYANCLKRVAEKSFLKRQLALAQAVVNRMRQLSLRVAQILDVNRPRSTRLWRPAVPLVLVAASLCGVSAWNAPAIVSFKDDGQPAAKARHFSAGGGFLAAQDNGAVKNAQLSTAEQSHVVLASAAIAQSKPAKPRLKEKTARAGFTRSNPARMLRTALPSPIQNGDYIVSEQFVVTMTGTPQNLQVHVWQIRVMLPVNNPSRAITRKNI